MFWVIEVVVKEGYKEVVELVVCFFDVGVMVWWMMYKNFYLWIEGNFVVMVIVAVVEVVVLFLVLEDEINFERFNVGEVLFCLN